MSCYFSETSNFTYMRHILHSYDWQIIKQVSELLAAWRVSDSQSPLVERETMPSTYEWVCQPISNAVNGLANSKIQAII